SEDLEFVDLHHHSGPDRREPARLRPRRLARQRALQEGRCTAPLAPRLLRNVPGVVDAAAGAARDTAVECGRAQHGSPFRCRKPTRERSSALAGRAVARHRAGCVGGSPAAATVERRDTYYTPCALS